MAHIQEGFRLPLKAASAIAQYVPVMFLAGGSALSETVQRAGSTNDVPVGFAMASCASPGDEISVMVDGVAKGFAGASIGAGALLGVGSTNGVLIPIMASGVLASAGASAGLTLPRWRVGMALKNAAAGDVFPVLIDIDQVL